MEIIIINDFSYVNGGIGKVSLNSALGLAKAGHQVTVFSAVPPAMTELSGTNPKLILSEQNEILMEPNRLKAAVQGVWNFKAGKKFSELLDFLNPRNTIIHFHGWNKALSASVINQSQVKGFKTVCTLHDYSMVCPNGALYIFPKDEMCRLTPLSGRCIATNCDSRSYQHKIWRVARQLVQKYFGRAPKNIKNYIVISEFSEEILKKHLPADARIFHVKNPILIDKEQPIDSSQNEYFTFVGRLSREKGPVLFAQAAKVAGVTPLYLGDGEYRDRVLYENPSAIVTGWLSNGELKSRLQNSRALVFPSLWYETHGLVVSECAALGLPAIVPDTSAAREFIINGKTGVLFKGGDRQDLAEKINLLKDPVLVRQMGSSAYEHYWNNPLTLDRHTSELENVYGVILSE